MTRSIMEDPVWLIIVGLMVTLLLGFIWTRTKHVGWLIGCIAALILMIGMVALERFVETDQEKLRRTLAEMANAVEDNDVDTLVTFVSPDVPECTRRIRAELPAYDFAKFEVTQVNAMAFDDPKKPQRAMVVVLASARVKAGGNALVGNDEMIGQRRVALFFEKSDDGRWLMYDYDHGPPLQPFRYLPKDDGEPTFMEGPGNFRR